MPSKDKMFSLRIPGNLLEEYRQFCEENSINISKRLRKFIESVNREVDLVLAAKEENNASIYANSYVSNEQALVLPVKVAKIETEEAVDFHTDTLELPLTAAAKTDFVALFNDLGDASKAQLKELWQSEYSALRLDSVKRCIVHETKAIGLDLPSIESFIKGIFDKEIDGSIHRNFGKVAHSALNELVAKLKTAILSYSNERRRSKRIRRCKCNQVSNGITY